MDGILFRIGLSYQGCITKWLNVKKITAMIKDNQKSNMSQPLQGYFICHRKLIRKKIQNVASRS